MTAWLWMPVFLAPTLMAVLLVLDVLERGVRSPEPLDPGGRARPATSGSDPAGPDPTIVGGRRRAGPRRSDLTGRRTRQGHHEESRRGRNG